MCLISLLNHPKSKFLRLFCSTGKYCFFADYSTSAAAPPTPKSTPRSTSKKELVYRNPFYRPTTPPPTPAIPPGALPAALPGDPNSQGTIKKSKSNLHDNSRYYAAA